MFRPVSRLVLALSLATAPVVAIAQQAPSATALSVARAGESTQDASQLGSDPSFLYAVGLLAIVIIGAYVLSSDDNSASP